MNIYNDCYLCYFLFFCVLRVYTLMYLTTYAYFKVEHVNSRLYDTAACVLTVINNIGFSEPIGGANYRSRHKSVQCVIIFFYSFIILSIYLFFYFHLHRKVKNIHCHYKETVLILYLKLRKTNQRALFLL